MSNNVAIIGMGILGQSICHSIIKDGNFERIYIIDKNQQLIDGLYLDFSHAAVNYGLTQVEKGNTDSLKDCNFVIIAIEGDKKSNDYSSILKLYDEVLLDLKKTNYNNYIIIASSPVDLLTFYVYKKLNISKNKIIGGGTLLDSKRFKFILSKKLNVSSNALQGFVLGSHDGTLVPIYSLTRVYSAKLNDYVFNHNICIDKEEVYEELKKCEKTIIEKVGFSVYGYAESISEILKSIALNKGSILPLSIISSSNDYAISLPTIITSKGAFEFTELYFDKEEILELEKAKADALDKVNKIL